jgi:hypothetical protein
MNQVNEHSSNIDPELSAGYREIANESAPARLDVAVLRQAAKEARPMSNLTNYFYSFRRPLAFAATLVLALSMVLQFDELLTDKSWDLMNGVTEVGESSTGAGEISSVIDASVEHIEEQVRQGENAVSQGLRNNPMPNAVGGSEAMRPDIVRFCDSAQTASAQLWWECIFDLDRNGRFDESESERQLLINTYPDFLPPK